MNNVKRLIALTALAFTYGSIYLLPYMKSSFYTQMIEATGFTNAQLGQLVAMYGLMCTISYLPGGWLADKFSPRALLSFCSIINGALCVVFYMFRTDFTIATVVWGACALTGGFAFWPSMLKGIRLLGTKDEQGRMYGLFEFINGMVSLLLAFGATFVAAQFANNIAGFEGIVLTFAAASILGGLSVWFFFSNDLVYNEEAQEEEGKEKITLKEFLQVLIMPRVWVCAAIMFVCVTLVGGLGYLNPYMTGSFGIAAATASFLSSFIYYGTRFGGIFGGYMADKVFKSSAKWQVIAHISTAGLFALLLFIPTTAVTVFIMVVILLGCAVYMNRSTAYSLLTELRIPPRISGTALALITLVGYMPDLFMHTMFGTWLDEHGQEGFAMIFKYVAAIGGIGVVLALISTLMSAKINKENS